MLELFSELPSLRQLEICSNAHTVHESQSTCLDGRVWRRCRGICPLLAVTLRSTGRNKNGLNFHPWAPVRSIVDSTPYSRITEQMVQDTVTLYRNELRVFAHTALPKFSRSSSFPLRCDNHYLLLVGQCQLLHTLVIRERISSCTLLTISSMAASLKSLHVRRNAVILRNDQSSKTQDQFSRLSTWLKQNSRSYNLLEHEVGRMLSQPYWQTLTDKQFLAVTVNI